MEKKISSARISHKGSSEVEQNVAPDSSRNIREHCPGDKERIFGGEDGVTDCLNSPRICGKYGLTDILWDAWCFVSIAGIWPRFIEPNMISTTSLTLKLPHLPKDLEGLRIVQLSDLHLNPKIPDRLINKLIYKVEEISPDIIFFTGDFLCCSKIQEMERMRKLLNSFKAPYGCYAILGNHDYKEYAGINSEGQYDIVTYKVPFIVKGLKMLFQKTKLKKEVTEKAKKVPPHPELIKFLKDTPFKLLHNETKQIPIKKSFLNVCGLGEYILGRCLPEEAFKNYDTKYPGIVLAHNPDSLPLLKNYPGEIVLSGHTHGGQVNLPLLWKKFTLLENIQFKRGLIKMYNKWLYINRGIGSVVHFRWFAMPEILHLTLEKEDD